MMQENASSNRNLLAAMTYLLGPITGIFFLVWKRYDPFIRFHAIQSIIVTTIWIVVDTILLQLPVVGIFLQTVISVGFFVLWLFLMWNAYNGTRYEIPHLWNIISRYVRKP